jgi:hypothetical protein
MKLGRDVTVLRAKAKRMTGIGGRRRYIRFKLVPLCLLEYEYPDLGGIGHKRTLVIYFGGGVVRSTDWACIEPSIETRHDENGRRYVHLIDD